MDRVGSEASKTKSMIYFIQSIESQVYSRLLKQGPIKIGFTDDPDLRSRFHQLRTGNPYPLRVLGVIVDGTREAERVIHREFQSQRLEGEWFRCTTALSNFIYRYSSGYAWGKSASVSLPKKLRPEIVTKEVKQLCACGVRARTGSSYCSRTCHQKALLED